MSAVIRHVAESIAPASRANAEAARAAVAGAGAPMLERLAALLAGAQHAPRPRAERRLLVIFAGDHGAGDPGIAMGPDHPTVIAAHAIAAGTAAVSQLARAAHTPVMLIDAGSREPTHMPATAVALGRGPTRDLAREPAMTIVDATLGLEAGIALAMSLAEGDVPLAVLALGALGLGAEVASAALVGAITGRVPAQLNDPHAELAAHRGVAHRELGAPQLVHELALATGTTELPLTREAGFPIGSTKLPLTPREPTAEFPTGTTELPLAPTTAELPRIADELADSPNLVRDLFAAKPPDPLELLATFGGSETAVMAGLILGLASINVPVILDSFATGAAALIATLIAPDVAGYLIAAHRGSFTMPAILEHLHLQPIFDVGLGHGEGSGAAMILPLVDQTAELATSRV